MPSRTFEVAFYFSGYRVAQELEPVARMRKG